MTVVYINEPLPKSWESFIFLLGPTPRLQGDGTSPPSWRPEALAFFEAMGYDGVIFIPETRDDVWKHNYDDQIEQEERGLNYADVIVAWMPRELTLMPAFTSNDEWGVWKTLDPARLVFGAPSWAVKVKYQKYYAEKFHIPVFNTLEETCRAALVKIGNTNGKLRSGGERSVPLHIWRTPSFQNWYADLQAAGNRLESARVEWVFRVGKTKERIFFWALHVDIYIAVEDRHKVNEVVIGRPDISTILLYEQKEPVTESRIVMVQEFRSPVSNADGYVYELAGGSSWDAAHNPLDIAAEECAEEVGLHLAPERFIEQQKRQIAATTLYHRAHLFSAALTTEEMDEVENNSHIIRGVESDTERTWARVFTYGELLAGTTVDWSMIGMIASVLR
jgi:hypothetical protein